MNIQGKLHRITSITAFLASWLKTNGHPTTGFVAWPKARIDLATDFPSGQFTGGFIPNMSMSTKTDSNGFFQFSTLALTTTTFRGRLVAFNVSSMVIPPIAGIALPPIPVFEPIYRSQPFKFADVSAAEQAQVQHIYAMEVDTPNEQGLTQTMLNQRLELLRTSLKLDKLSASILPNRISVTASKSGGDVNFDAFVVGSTSEDLTRVIEAGVGEIDIDLPGPDFIVGLCISKSDIKAAIRSGMADTAKQLSQGMIKTKDTLLKQGNASSLIPMVGLTSWRTRHPQTSITVIKVQGLKDIQAPSFSVVPDLAIGLPVKLYTN